MKELEKLELKTSYKVRNISSIWRMIAFLPKIREITLNFDCSLDTKAENTFYAFSRKSLLENNTITSIDLRSRKFKICDGALASAIL